MLLGSRFVPSANSDLFLPGPGLQHLRFKKTRQKLYNDESLTPPTSTRHRDAPIEGDAFKALLKLTGEKMAGSVAYYEKQIAVLESRASGRVMPSLLEGVKVPSVQGDVRYKLRDVASIGVKEGTTLLVTVFEPSVSGADRRKYLVWMMIYVFFSESKWMSRC